MWCIWGSALIYGRCITNHKNSFVLNYKLKYLDRESCIFANMKLCNNDLQMRQSGSESCREEIIVWDKILCTHIYMRIQNIQRTTIANTYRICIIMIATTINLFTNIIIILRTLYNSVKSFHEFSKFTKYTMPIYLVHVLHIHIHTYTLKYLIPGFSLNTSTPLGAYSDRGSGQFNTYDFGQWSSLYIGH